LAVHVTDTEHVALGASIVTAHPLAANCDVSLVVTVGMPVADVPMFLTVYVAIVVDVLPMTAEPQLPLAGVFAVIDSVPGTVPVPLRLAAPSVPVEARTFSVAASGPCDFGANWTSTVHALPAATVAPLHRSFATANDVGLAPVRLLVISAADATSP
jgi:hypothetical protein